MHGFFIELRIKREFNIMNIFMKPMQIVYILIFINYEILS